MLIKRGMSESLFEELPQKQVEQSQLVQVSEEQEELPDFLKNSMEKAEESVVARPSRNLSIIQEIESVI